ncbi:DUF6262 family protein [Nocardia sp. CC227C]|uniref:DUF6262 family protein n=1 Tax=Nocardia sp. CC227C TaxID=3044562 RepID=UPI00278C1837|nr:DUF6262 family protein [Nocardia sp. CC227C]
MRADNSAALAANARERAQQTKNRALRMLTELEAAHQPTSIAGFCQLAGVSRSWVYSQPDLVTRLDALRADFEYAPPPQLEQPASRASDQSLLVRLEIAHQRIRALGQENERLRAQLACTLGELRFARITTTVADSVHDTNPPVSSSEVGKR